MHMTTDPAAAEALAVLRATPAVMRALLSGLPPAAAARPNPEGWSAKDLVAHLLDTEGIAFGERIRRILSEDSPEIAPIDPPARLLEGGYAARGLDDLLAELEHRRPADLEWLATLLPEQWERPGRHQTAGRITPRDILHQWAYHDLTHLRQLLELLQAGQAPALGNTRAFYPEAAAFLAWPR